MKIKMDSQGTLAKLEKMLREVDKDENCGGILILACDENGFTPEEVNPLLTSLNKPVFGGIFPQIISGNKNMDKGSLVVGLSVQPEVHIIPSISNSDNDFSDIIDQKIPETGLYTTMFVLVDGLSKRIGDLIRGIFNILGLELNIIGGGAGSLSFNQKPCIFTNEGLKKDCAQLVLTQLKSGIGVSHGWNSISGPYRVTKSSGNTIETIDWKPAYEIYKEVVENASGKSFSDSEFFELAKAYPFGINKMGEEKIVRDPIIVDEKGALICVGEVPEGSYVDILEGNIASLVAAAQRAMELGLDSFPGRPEDSFKFFIDCISRVLFMEDEFHQEMEAVNKTAIPLIGALTLGEIANSGRDYLEFYNKTAVLGVMGA